MKKLNNLLKNHKYICFLDFEGTQFTHEMIAIGALFCSLDKNGLIKKEKKPFKLIVLPKNKVGNFVTNLTGITEEMIRKQGVKFSVAMNELKKYCGAHFTKCSFLTYGNHDLTILNKSISYNLDYPKDICSQIQKNYLDFQTFIAEFIRDAKGNALSVIHLCELFNIKQAGEAHDPSVDAINLAHIYNEFNKQKELVRTQYKNVLNIKNNFPEPVKEVMKKLLNGETVTEDDFDNFVKRYLN